MSNRRGFTLLELSIVIVVIGLIVGGIVVGRSMIKSAQLQSIVSEVTTYQSAVKNFRDKYSALPGDFSGAEAIWGSDASCPGTSYTASPHSKTCNGNGDGNIGSSWSTNPVTTYDYEVFRAWQQLSDAGLIEGSYTGVKSTGSSSMSSTLGINIPASRYEGAGYSLAVVYLPAGDANNWPHTLLTYHVFRFGGILQSSTGSDASMPLMTPSDALQIDSKMDDGRPSAGKVMPYKSPANPNCTTSDSVQFSTYAVTNVGQYCSLSFLLDF